MPDEIEYALVRQIAARSTRRTKYPAELKMLHETFPVESMVAHCFFYSVFTRNNELQTNRANVLLV